MTTLAAVSDPEHLKLSDDAKQRGVRYETAWRWYRDGNIPGRRVGPRTILIPEGQESPATSAASRRVAGYARVSTAENKSHLESQAERLAASCAARG